MEGDEDEEDDEDVDEDLGVSGQQMAMMIANLCVKIYVRK